MLLSNSANFIYIKTNKTASTSVEMALQPFCQIDPLVRVEEKTHTVVSETGIIGQRLIPNAQAKDLDLMWYNHMSAAEIKDKVGADIWENCHKIHAVRNPFDKVLSSFFWKSSLRGLTYDTLAEAIAMFESYVLEWAWNTDYGILHIDDQYAGTKQVRYEKLSEDLQKIATDLDLDARFLNLPHTKQTAKLRMGHDLHSFYTQPSIDCVLERCDWIFDYFGYSTDISDT